MQPGDRVKAGQPLARLDVTDFRLQREQAEAELSAAGASLAQAEAEDRRILLLRGKAGATASNADRQRALVEEARGRLNRAERAVSLASNSLSYATLAADADGVVTATKVEPGQVVALGQPAVRLAKAGAHEAVVAIPEALVDRVKSARARVSLWSEPGRAYDAALRELSPSADDPRRAPTRPASPSPTRRPRSNTA